MSTSKYSLLHGRNMFASFQLSRIATGYPPAIAPRMMNGSAPVATASGSGVSGSSWERSWPHAKKRSQGLLVGEPWLRMVPRRTGNRASIALLPLMYPFVDVPKLERKWAIWNDYKKRHALNEICAEGGI